LRLEHERLETVRFLEAANRRDVRVVQRCEDLCFAPEPREPIGIVREGVRQDLEGYVAVQLGVARAIDLSIPPAPRSATTSYAPSRAPGARDMMGKVARLYGQTSQGLALDIPLLAKPSPLTG